MKKQLLKRAQNVTPAKKKQGATPSRKRQRGISFESSSSLESSTDDTESNASTIILERSPQSTSSSSEGELVDGKSTY